MTPAEEITAAAKKLRALIDTLPANDWGDRPWQAEECSDTDDMSPCPCIVSQGEYRDFDQPQIPLIQYVADAENPEFAAYIAAMGPGVGKALTDWLEHEASLLRVSGAAGEARGRTGHALAVARAILGDQP